MGYLEEFLVLLVLGGLLGIVLAWLNGRLLLRGQGAESMRILGYVFFVVLGVALATVGGFERAYKGLFDELAERMGPAVHQAIVVADLDPARVPVGEVGRMLEVMDQALHREIARQDAAWFLEFLEGWNFSVLLEGGRELARIMQRADTVDIDRVWVIARDTSFGYLFPWAQRAFWVLLALFPFFAWLLWVSVGGSRASSTGEIN